MSSYAEVTAKIADQWVAAYKSAEDSLARMAEGTRKATAKFDVPAFPVAEQVSKLTDSLTGQLPKPSEVVQANFELATRLLAAQRDFALRVLELNAAEVAEVKNSTVKASATKA